MLANKAERELLDFVLAAEVWQGLHEDHDHDCGAKELLAGLMFVDPSKDLKTHMQQLLAIENPRGMAGLAKQKFAQQPGLLTSLVATGSLIPTPY